MSMLDSLFGVQRLFVHAIESVTRKRWDMFGDVRATDNPLGRTELDFGLTFTPVKTGSYVATYGDMVRISAAGNVTLPLAVDRPRGNSRVGVVLTANAAVNVVAGGSDTIEWGALAFTTKNQTVTLQSDGVSKWWVVAKL